MNKTTYSQALRHPEWQKKRLKIMERDGFACRTCSATHKTLNVHHILYNQGALPWQYHDHQLFTLCEDCHKEEEANKTTVDENLVFIFRTAGGLNQDISRIISIVNELTDTGHDRAGIPLITDALDRLLSERKERRK